MQPNRPKQQSDGNESASETDEDTAKIEAVWKQKLEATTKNAIKQLTTQHKEELSAKEQHVDTLTETVDKLRMSYNESSEYYYQLYLEKCELSLILQEKQIELKRSKDKQREMGKRYFQQQQRTEELESKLNQISTTFSSRMSAIQSQPKKHRPTKSTVNDLASIEAQFRNLLKNGDDTDDDNNSSFPDTTNNNNEYLENQIIELNSKLNQNNDELLLLKQENNKLKNQLSSKQGGSDQFYQERTNKLSAKVSLFQQNIYNLMSLLQNVEQEYMQKCGKLPKVTKAIDWRNEYDPKQYKSKQLNQSTTSSVPSQPTNQKIDTKKSKKSKKSKKKEIKTRHQLHSQ